MESEEIVYAKDQPEYVPLPVLRSSDGRFCLLSRWTFTEAERRAIANGADVFLETLTFGHPLQPTRLFIGEPENLDLLDYFVKEYRK